MHDYPLEWTDFIILYYLFTLIVCSAMSKKSSWFRSKNDTKNLSLTNSMSTQPIKAKCHVKVDIDDLPDGIDFKPEIKFEVVCRYKSGKKVKSKYKTTLITEDITEDNQHNQQQQQNKANVESQNADSIDSSFEDLTQIDSPAEGTIQTLDPMQNFKNELKTPFENGNSNGNSNANSNSNSYVNSNSNPNLYTTANSVPNSYSNSNSNLNSNTKPKSIPNSNSNSNPNSYPKLNSYPNSYFNPNSNLNSNPNFNFNSNLNSNSNSNSISDSNQHQKQITNVVSSSDTNEYNILLLGETGAGKSTTINAFANYIKYASFEEAKAGEFTQLIPTKFSRVDPLTDKSVVVQLGSDENESHRREGESCTQSPVGYLFKNGKNHVRIIDTPGMGDTRGVEVDRENFDQIINFIIHFKNLHGICILIQSNETRKTSSFRYCITELLDNLHRSACKNIFFCFTFARYTNFGAGDGYSMLKSFLQNELRENGLNLSQEVNCFFIDNEAYRYLVAKKRGISLDKEEEEKCEESWTMSSRNTNMMINRITKLAPHDIEQTRLLNHTQKLMMLLAEPLVLMQRNLHINLQEISLHVETLKMYKLSNKSQPHFIQVNIVDLEWEKLPHPKTVCTESRCVKFTDYKSPDQSCHNACSEIETPNGIVGSTQLKKCTQMSLNGSCTKCGCHWRKHMHLTAQYSPLKGSIVNQFVYNYPLNPGSSTGKIIDALEKQINKYQQRLKVLETISAKLAFLTQRHSNTSSNKFIEPILDKLINDEVKQLKYSATYSNAISQILEQMKEGHKQRVQEIANKFAAKMSADVKFDYVSGYCEQLAEIKPLDEVLKNFNDYKEKELRMFQRRDVTFDL